LVICVAEDRKSEEVAVRLLLASLAEHSPGLSLILFYPPATDEMRRWLRGLGPVDLRTRMPGGSGWDVKAYALLELLKSGEQDVCWLDADVIVTRDVRPLFSGLTDSSVVVTEEALYGLYGDDGFRAKAWGLEVGRRLPFVLNTAVLRVTRSHLALVKRWCELLESDRYRNARALPWHLRPFHLIGDQDVLTALLSSAEFSDIPLRILRRGREILQCFGLAGFTLRERILSAAWGLPPLVHAQRDKPWKRAPAPPGWRAPRAALNYAWMEVTPYNHVAARYRRSLGLEMEWLEPRSGLGRALRLLGCGNPALTGAPISILYAASRLAKDILGVRDRFEPATAFEVLRKK
jgi:hypothetical protein